MWSPYIPDHSNLPAAASSDLGPSLCRTGRRSCWTPFHAPSVNLWNGSVLGCNSAWNIQRQNIYFFIQPVYLITLWIRWVEFNCSPHNCSLQMALATFLSNSWPLYDWFSFMMSLNKYIPKLPINAKTSGEESDISVDNERRLSHEIDIKMKWSSVIHGPSERWLAIFLFQCICPYPWYHLTKCKWNT